MKNFILKSLLICCCLFLINDISAQVGPAYKPVLYQGPMPKELSDEFYRDTEARILRLDELNGDLAKRLVRNITQEKKNLLQNGEVYFDEDINAVPRKILKKLTARLPDIANNLSIYVTRRAVVNAHVFPDGTIFINSGLLARMESEDEIAFIIAHEIAHYEKSHGIVSLLRKATIDKEELNYNNDGGMIYRLLQYSKEHEFESDARAIQLMNAAGYNPKASFDALFKLEDTLKLSGDVVEMMNLSLWKEHDLIDDTSGHLDKVVAKKKSTRADVLFSGNGEGDAYSTHPETGKRILAAKEIVAVIPNPVTAELTPYDNSKANYEVINNLFEDEEYHSSLFTTLVLLEKYPENPFLQTMLMKNFYWVCVLRSLEKLDKCMEKNSLNTGIQFSKVCYVLEKTDLGHMRRTLHGGMKAKQEELKNEEDFVVYYAMTTEVFLGKEAGKFMYDQYLLNFSDGKYVDYAKNKINEQ